MTISSRPWTGKITGDAGPYSDVQWRQIYRDAFQSENDKGPLLGADDEFAVTITSPASSSVEVQTGSAFIQGVFIQNDAVETLSIGANSSGNDRIDVVYLQINYTTQTASVGVKAGTPAGSPVAPTLTQSATVWQVPLAEVYATNGFLTIAATDITDRRVFANNTQRMALRLTNAEGSTVEQGRFVKIKSGASSQFEYSDGSDLRVFGVTGESATNTSACEVVRYGLCQIYVDTAASAGDKIAMDTSTTAGEGEVVVAGDRAYYYAVVLEDTSQAGLAWCWLLGNEPIPFRNAASETLATRVTTTSTSSVGSTLNATITKIYEDSYLEVKIELLNDGDPFSNTFHIKIYDVTAAANLTSDILVGDLPNTGAHVRGFTRTEIVSGVSAGSQEYEVYWRTQGNVFSLEVGSRITIREVING